jgi:hypothetical protein
VAGRRGEAAARRRARRRARHRAAHQHAGRGGGGTSPVECDAAATLSFRRSLFTPPPPCHALTLVRPPHLKMTSSSGSFFSLLLMKRSRCFWCMHALWWMCVSTWTGGGARGGFAHAHSACMHRATRAHTRAGTHTHTHTQAAGHGAPQHMRRSGAGRRAYACVCVTLAGGLGRGGACARPRASTTHSVTARLPGGQAARQCQRANGATPFAHTHTTARTHAHTHTHTHTRARTHNRAHLADVVEVPVWRALLREELLVRVEHHVQVELLLQQHQPWCTFMHGVRAQARVCVCSFVAVCTCWWV